MSDSQESEQRGQAQPAEPGSQESEGFRVTTDAYSGPFDVLLAMIAHKRLEITQVSLSAITEEFAHYVAAMDLTKQADEASAFLVVASVLVEAKSVALLPTDSPRDEESLEALRQRDLLFARLLQYKAFKEAGNTFRTCLAAHSGMHEHHPQIEERFSQDLRDVRIGLSTYDLALYAARALTNAPAPTVSTAQLHVPLADLRVQSGVVRAALIQRRGQAVDFADVIADAPDEGVVVARFLAVLAFFKLGYLQFRQRQAYATLELRWVASADAGAGMDNIGTEDFS